MKRFMRSLIGRAYCKIARLTFAIGMWLTGLSGTVGPVFKIGMRIILESRHMTMLGTRIMSSQDFAHSVSKKQ